MLDLFCCEVLFISIFYRVQFPDPQSRYRSNQVTVTGTMEAAFKAREQLLVRYSILELL